MMNTTTWIKKVYLSIAIVVIAILVFVIFIVPSLSDSQTDTIKVETFRTFEGWGYQIKVNNEVYIYQPFIPGHDKQPFSSKRIANKAGRLVSDKLRSGNIPNLTREELITIGAIEATEE